MMNVLEMDCLAHGMRNVTRFGRARRTWLAREGWVFRLTCGCARYLIREDSDERTMEQQFYFSAAGEGTFLSYDRRVKHVDRLSWAYPRPATDRDDAESRTRARVLGAAVRGRTDTRTGRTGRPRGAAAAPLESDTG